MSTNLYSIVHDLAPDVELGQRRLIVLLSPDPNYMLAGYAKLSQSLRLNKWIKLEYPATIHRQPQGTATVEQYLGADGSFLVDITEWGVGVGFLGKSFVPFYQTWLRSAHPELFPAAPPQPQPALEPAFDHDAS